MLFPALAVAVKEKGKEERPLFFKDVLHGAIQAICYMLATTCLLVAS